MAQMKRPDNIYAERQTCPLYAAIGVISGRWKPMILQRLTARPTGFGELQRSMPRITRKVLREQLLQLQADGLVTREPRTPKRLGVCYSLTPYAKTLNPVFTVLRKWGVQHLGRLRSSS